MQSFTSIFAALVAGVVCTQSATAQVRFGAQGAEGEPDRVQQRLVPSSDSDTAAHAVR